jgi:hypothetical protein
MTIYHKFIKLKTFTNNPFLENDTLYLCRKIDQSNFYAFTRMQIH